MAHFKFVQVLNNIANLIINMCIHASSKYVSHKHKYRD